MDWMDSHVLHFIAKKSLESHLRIWWLTVHIHCKYELFGDSSQIRVQQCSIVMLCNQFCVQQFSIVMLCNQVCVQQCFIVMTCNQVCVQQCSIVMLCNQVCVQQCSIVMTCNQVCVQQCSIVMTCNQVWQMFHHCPVFYWNLWVFDIMMHVKQHDNWELLSPKIGHTLVCPEGFVPSLK